MGLALARQRLVPVLYDPEGILTLDGRHLNLRLLQI